MFVSYSRSDFYFAEQLAVALRRRGLDVWFDVHELAPGSDWSEAIDRAIEECDDFVLVASRASLESPYVQRERELADRLGRPQTAVQAGRAAVGLPAYDLRNSFERGATRLAVDLAAGTATGWRPRVRLPWPVGACVVALAPALAVLCAVLLAVVFLHRVIGHVVFGATHVGLRVGLVGAVVALIGVPQAWLLRAFLRRRVGWIYLRGSLATMWFVAIVGAILAGQMAAAVATYLGAAANALGVTPDPIHFLGPEALGVLLIPVCVAGFVATELSPGLCRVLRTGAAPRRIRKRHAGVLPRPEAGGAVHAYRLFAVDDDVGVAEEVRRSFADAGIEEAADGERDVVVLTDRTPVEWLSRGDLRDPLAIVATSIALPVRGVLDRFQWVDHRARRRRTLETLARDLAAEAGPAEARAPPDVPEGLQRLRLPVPVTITEWMLYSMAVVAAEVGLYSIVLAFEGRRDLAWPAALCVAVAPVPVVLAVRLRRRRITLRLLVLALALCWLALIGLGMDAALRRLFTSSEIGSHNAATFVYPILSAAVVALSWRSLRSWLPPRLRPRVEGTLGTARGSLGWVAILAPALLATVGGASLDPPKKPTPALAATDVCRDRAGLESFSKPLPAADRAVVKATRATVVAAFENRIAVVSGVVDALASYEPHGTWGAGMQKRLISGLSRTVRADRAYIHHEIDGKAWVASRHELDRAAADLARPIC